MPSSWLSQNSFRNGGSVPSCCVTLYCMGVSFFWSSLSLGFLNVSVTFRSPFGVAGGDCATAPSEHAVVAMVNSANTSARYEFDIYGFLDAGLLHSTLEGAK